jgi:hypothetical protein
MRVFGRQVFAVLFVVVAEPALIAHGVQTPAAPAKQMPPATEPAPPPATKLEGFKPVAGSVTIVGYEVLGRVTGFTGYVSVEVRQLRDTHDNGARGLVVEVYEGQSHQESSFVDEEEIPELWKGIDALLAVKANPSPFKSFEIRYLTRGELELSVFSATNKSGELRIDYALAVGRLLKERRGLDAGDMRKLRGLFEAGLQKVNSTNNKWAD